MLQWVMGVIIESFGNAGDAGSPVYPPGSLHGRLRTDISRVAGVDPLVPPVGSNSGG